MNPIRIQLLAVVVAYTTLCGGVPVSRLHHLLAQEKKAIAPQDPQNADLRDPKNIDIHSLTELRVKLLGEDGQPVQGAAVMPYAMRMEGIDGHGYWNREKLGPPKDYVSDNSGVATILYPAQVYSLPRPMRTHLVTFQVRHSDYVSKVVHLDLGPDLNNPLQETVVDLKRGCELQISAVDDADDAITEFAVAMAGPYEPEIWSDDGEGGKRTSALNDGTWQTMLVKPQESGPTLFSGVLPLRVRPNQSLRVRNVKLSPGARIVGQLSENVPRPVREGYAMITCVPRPAGENWADDLPSLCWHDWIEIAEDGSFEFTSVPRSGEIQIIVVCEGWLSTTKIAEARSFVMGQLYNVQEPLSEVVVEMEQTGTLLVKVLGPDGLPLTEGSVSSWPNQRYYKGGSTLVGNRFRTIDSMINQLLPQDQKRRPDFPRAELPFVDCPIENGVAVLRGIPVNHSESLNLAHDDFRLGNEDQRYRLKSVAAEELTLHAVPHSQPTPAELMKDAAGVLNAFEKAVDKLFAD